MTINWRMMISILILSTSAIAAQTLTGAITGRVVTEDGTAMPNMTVTLYQAGAAGNAFSGAGAGSTAITDEDGNFRFENLSRRVYTINVTQAKEYTKDRRNGTQVYRVGDSALIMMVKGGVLTGKVTRADGDPMVGVLVHPVLVKDAEGNPVRGSSGGRARLTDDRGIYRLYGLAPGTYVIYADGKQLSGVRSADNSPRTYHPSSTRDTATAVTVAIGSETMGIDIRFHRNQAGHSVSGTIIPGSQSSSQTDYGYVSLVSAATGTSVASETYTATRGNAFAFYGIPDGDYEISATQSSSANENMMVSMPRRITLRGGDVTGIELKLTLTASIAGRAVLEASPNTCDPKNKRSIEEMLISALGTGSGSASSETTSSISDYAVNEKGEFLMWGLKSGNYRINASRLPENWYVKSITAPGKTPATMYDGSRAGMPLKLGDKVTGLILTLAEGASGLRGKVVSEKEGESLTAKLRIHLVPSNPGLADNQLLYDETLAGSDGTFVFKNRAPGKYWILARPVLKDEAADRPPLPAAWDANERAKLRKDAEAKKIEVELKACTNATDQIVKY